MALALGCGEPEPPDVGDACDGLRDCAEGQRLVCIGGQCARETCGRTVECPPQAACVDGYCDVAQCEVSTDCPDGQRCFEGACRDDICETNSECASDDICGTDVPRTCQSPPPFCSNNAECLEGLACSLPGGRCVSMCVSEQDCQVEEYCGFNGLCRSPCESSVECPADSVCARGRCEQFSCDEGRCESARPYRDPITCGCVECLVDSACPGADESCLDSGACVYCPQRGTRDECGRQGLVFNQGCCSECIDDVDCPAGLACDRGRCEVVDPRECLEDSDCDGLAVCDNGRCRPDGSRSACSTQAECPEGEACYGDGRCRLEAAVCESCQPPTRCVAEIGDFSGACTGCTQECEQSECADDEVCVIRDDASEGFCTERVFSGCF